MSSSVADAKVTKTSLTGSDTFRDVLVEAGKSVRVRVEAEVKAQETTTPAKAGKFNLILDGEDENDNDAGHAERKTANMMIVKKGSVSITDSSVAKKAVLRKASSAKIAEFTVKPDGANSVSLEEISFDLTFDAAYDGDVDLYVGGAKKKLTKPS
jgi:flagellar hook assembly protein FlgD